MTLALDGTPGTNGGQTGTTATVTLTTTNASDVLILFSLQQAASIIVNNITDNSGKTATWTKRIALVNAAGASLEEWWTTTTGTMTGATITAHYSGSTTFANLVVVAISGANVGAPFDTHVGLPATTNHAAADPQAISTTTANTFIISAFRFSSTTNPTAGTNVAWISDYAAQFMLVEHIIVSSPQSALSCTVGTGVGDSSEIIADAVIDSASGDVLMPMICM